MMLSDALDTCYQMQSIDVQKHDAQAHEALPEGMPTSTFENACHPEISPKF
jgi:hypothetical protein